MYLKRLQIHGFKTFADTTEIDLTPGVTAVVGPNGSGKSNIADAILWALGEQNVRHLRGVKTSDVIFAGSDNRKPLGMAEVSLMIDNSSGRLPIDYSEVTITRRAYRSGEGEYFINKVPCRLKDIHELFLDTGSGREAYSMVSQGEIDSILSAKSEDRRALFEEAAGIKKYRHRRKETLRKLESTEANLRRVNDIISELATQVEPLAEQAEVARRYNELIDRLREIEIGLLIQDLRRQTSELDSTTAAKEGSNERLTELDRKLSDLEWDKERHSTELAELDKQVDTARIADQETATEVQRLQSRLAVLDERYSAAEELVRSSSVEIEQLEIRLCENRERREALVSEGSAIKGRESELSERVAEKSVQERDFDAKIEDATRRASTGKADYIERAKEIAAKRNASENVRARLADLQAALTKIEAEITGVEDAGKDAARALEESLRDVKSLEEAIDTSGKKIQSLAERRGTLRNDISAAQAELDSLGKRMVEQSSRLATLREMAEAHEGFFDGVRAVMAARKSGHLKGHYAVVADVIDVPPGYELAFDVALGSSLQNVITDTVDDGKRAIRLLKETRAGRATFLPLKGIRPVMACKQTDFAKSPGFLGSAVDILKFDKKYAPAINVLLGRTLVVDTIDNAVELARSTVGWGKIVTLDGEVIMPTGAMTGGTRPGKGHSLLTRRQEIAAISSELDNMQSEYQRLEEQISGLRDELADLDAGADDLSKQNADRRVALADTERRAKFCEQEHSRIDNEIQIAQAEKEEIDTCIAKETDCLNHLLIELENADEGEIGLDALVAAAEKEREKLQASRDALSSELLEIKIELASTRERVAGLESAIRNLDNEIEHLDGRIREKRRQIEEAEVDSADNRREANRLREQLEVKESELKHADHGLEGLIAKRAELAAVIAKVDADFRETGKARAELSELVHAAEVREARLEVQISQISARLLEEYEITVGQALDWREPVEVERGTATEVARLRREVRAMGQVNTGAVAEYERVKERWDFLSAQREDLEKAKANLNHAIKEIDDSTRDIFMETFQSVAENFDQMFKRLFGGGVTRLELTDPSDLLETGIEIIVQPPGKKLQNLLLLSGGERALTASALLFALMKVRPSPFVVLDEVDAALDESNVERFAEVLRDFSRNSQFIVITHNRATMESSDILYGVSMQEPGVSNLISVRLSAEEPPILSEPDTITAEVGN